MSPAEAHRWPRLRWWTVSACLALAVAGCALPDEAPEPPAPPASDTDAPSAAATPDTPTPTRPGSLGASPTPSSPAPFPTSSPTLRTLPEGIVHAADVAYGPHERQAVDTYVPASDVPGPTGDPDSRPAMVLVHGGGWTTGHRDAYHDAAMALAARGWVAVTVGYRLAPAHQHPDAVADVRAALQHVHDHAAELGVDPARVVLGGDSAGGNLSGLVALADDRPPVAAWISWSGVHDFVALADRLPPDRAWLRDQVGAYLGCDDPDAAACADRARDASPVSLASADDPPTLLLHSTDELVPLSDAEAMRRALDEAGVPVTLQAFEGSAHGMQLQARSLDAVEAFLTDVLGLDP